MGVLPINASCHTHEWVISPVQLTHVAHIYLGLTTLTGDAMYPGRMLVSDVLGVEVSLEFMLRVCSSIKVCVVSLCTKTAYTAHLQIYESVCSWFIDVCCKCAAYTLYVINAQSK